MEILHICISCCWMKNKGIGGEAAFTHLDVKLWHSDEGMRYVCEDADGGRWV